MGYLVTEPHPSPSHGFIHGGRGGAGNYHRLTTAELTSLKSSTVASSKLTPPSSSTGMFSSGRGGAGNMCRESERQIFSFDEELERQRSREVHAAPVYHVGRGGAGNMARSIKGGSEAGSATPGEERGRVSVESRASRWSQHSTASGADQILGRIQRTFSHAS